MIVWNIGAIHRPKSKYALTVRRIDRIAPSYRRPITSGYRLAKSCWRVAVIFTVQQQSNADIDIAVMDILRVMRRSISVCRLPLRRSSRGSPSSSADDSMQTRGFVATEESPPIDAARLFENCRFWSVPKRTYCCSSQATISRGSADETPY